jgi:excisionase family DNA binding protein
MGQPRKSDVDALARRMDHVEALLQRLRGALSNGGGEVPSLFTVEEVAEAARVSVSTVRHWIVTGKLATVRPGKRRMVRGEELEKLLNGGH